MGRIRCSYEANARRMRMERIAGIRIERWWTIGVTSVEIQIAREKGKGKGSFDTRGAALRAAPRGSG